MSALIDGRDSEELSDETTGELIGPGRGTDRSVPCDHCGLPAPAPADGQLAFCCNGCRGAYELIHHWGLGDYYALRDGEAAAIDERAGCFDDLDRPDLLGRSAPTPIESGDGQRWLKTRLSVSGIHCAACLWLLEKAPTRLEGWHRSAVQMHDRTIEIVFDPGRIRLSQIAQVLARLGYTVTPLMDSVDADGESDQESQRLLVDIAIAGFCAANAMWLAVALYAGDFTGIAAEHASVFRVAGVLLGCVAVIFPGRVFFRGAMASLKTRTPHMDLPVALGLSAGLLGSLYGLLDASREVYFDSIAALVFFLLVGRWLQMRQQRRAGDEVAGLIQMAPLAANRLDDRGRTERIRVSELRSGDQVVVAPGESVSVDGVVVAGQSLIDRSLLTGESQPVEVKVDDCVEAGTDNLQAPITVRATSVGEQTRFAALRRSVRDAASSRTPVVQLANRVGGGFVIAVLALAILTGVIWWWRDPSRVIDQVVALLIVACPCALALATPLAIGVAIGRLASQRVLVRSGECLERLVRPGTIFFDKTGTLTEGRMRVTAWDGDETLVAVAAAIESDVRHPIASAVVAYSEQQRRTHPELAVEDVQQIAGVGVVASVPGVGTVAVGNAGMLRGGLDPAWQASVQRILQDGASPVYLVVDEDVRAVLGVSDRVRRDAAATVAWFQQAGWRVGMLSGDHQSTVDRVAEAVGIPSAAALGQLLPDQKLDAIRGARADGAVVMVGDGMNDAAALAAADVGIALRGGVEASLAAAPVIIGDAKLSKVIELAKASRSTRVVILRNFAVSIAYNVLAITLAMTGWITPLIAAILMPISSLSVILLSLTKPEVTQSDSSAANSPEHLRPELAR
ncbi:heavy metal translocating P-type ATPase [Roseiconus nitratireducens]|uniref:Heavy metal translocating P-type ATPase n=1 Tax=Roseiconus nitratireducens TaxID=2605748 RepID=A0A5M6DFM3_9BACT|nr:heavy metal translocating P-type ATPase [Roseiconus nitratireducens]KAA5545206.1 heavy metal translocating P-type ATPase [Roseiconus nitratireducens]